jgi:phosphoglycolate phosphatase-like HAD superfamily hydrolase
VLLDCDGVLLDSNRLKTAAFDAVLRDYPRPAVSGFLDFQVTAFGLSRYRLMDMFFAHYLKRPPLSGEKEDLLAGFSSYCIAGYRDCGFTDGALDALEAIRAAGLPMFVVSGSDERELKDVLAGKTVIQYFDAVYGSPASKDENIGKVGNQLAGRNLSMVFVGDARADFEASRICGCEFLYMGTWSADPAGMQQLKLEHGFREIGSLSELMPAIASLP